MIISGKIYVIDGKMVMADTIEEAIRTYTEYCNPSDKEIGRIRLMNTEDDCGLTSNYAIAKAEFLTENYVKEIIGLYKRWNSEDSSEDMCTYILERMT